MEKSKVKKEYSNGDITVVWNAALCTHTGKCVRGLSEVFDVKARPWINMQGADSQAIMEQVRACPSGALTIKGEQNDNSKAGGTKVRIIENGPLIIEGSVHLTHKGKDEILDRPKVSFCRCGASSNKPYCDGSHKGMNFDD